MEILEDNNLLIMLQKIRKIIYHSDMFCSSEMLRYNSQTQYKTLTGGLLSISIIAVILVGFASMISDTLNRTSITSTVQTIKHQNPTFSELKTDLEHNFMFGLSISSQDMMYYADLASGPRYFDVILQLIKVQNGIFIESADIIMEKCTPDHWKMKPQIAASYESLSMNTWLCPPLNTSLPLQGSATSPNNLEILIGISPCSNSTLYDRSCAPQAQIDSLIDIYRNFYFTINYLNPVINPNQPDHIEYYLQGNDYVIFSNVIGSQAWVYFADYTINTDNSIWPFQQNVVEKGCIVQQKSINHPFSVHQNTAYAYIFLAKSVNSLVYTRSVQKISAVLSYIGGLIGAITAVLFLIKSYTDTSLEIMIGFDIFSDKQDSEDKNEEKQANEKHNFNLFHYLVLIFCDIFRSFGVSKQWLTFNKLSEYQRQVNNQLDIKSLLKRMINLQKWMVSQMENYHLQALKYQKPLTCKQVKRLREGLLHQNQKKSVQRYEIEKQEQNKILNKCKGQGRKMNIIIQSMEIYSSKDYKQEIRSLQSESNENWKFGFKKRQNSLENNEIINVNAEIIPVQFMKKEDSHKMDESSFHEKRQNKKLIIEKSLLALQTLHKNIEVDKMSKKLWQNMRPQIKAIVTENNDSKEVEIF